MPHLPDILHSAFVVLGAEALDTALIRIGRGLPQQLDRHFHAQQHRMVTFQHLIGRKRVDNQKILGRKVIFSVLHAQEQRALQQIEDLVFTAPAEAAGGWILCCKLQC